MSIFSLVILKIPLLLVSSACDHVAFTAPNPSAQSEERAKYDVKTGASEKGSFHVVRAATTLRSFIHAVNLLELATIIRSIYHSEPQQCMKTFHGPHYIRDWSPSFVEPKIQISAQFLTGFTLMVLGASLRAISYRYLGKDFTFELAVRKEHKLVTTGPYYPVRHPSYTGAILFMAGAIISQMGHGSYWSECGLWHGAWGLILGLVYVALIPYVVVVIFLRMPNEDAILREEFKEDWDAWARRTPYRLIPFVH
ncbi:hypothetical protein PHLCEN_2v13261 [Hermanssonia centrifuga]|uniref:Protein-S-isoprenylcysteine O-methyltransferase n=1 Tax=Hermanssonia centrifuga TaxID=98765 RepID=A0A2R6NEL5_9APHY|nr:hypothetical protein PHLCEN_2v13261 [Hermanssonia centrifuga]